MRTARVLFLLVVVGAALACSGGDAAIEPGEAPVDPPARDGGSIALPEPDSGAPVDASRPRDALPDVPPVRLYRVFVTSTTSNANLGGLAGADAKCQALATAASLGGTWVAWLSVENGPHAEARITSPGPYHLLNGELVASTKAELLGGTLKHAIDRDENDALVAPGRVWTGSGANGRYSTNDCDKWTNGNEGRVGSSGASNAQWTSQAVVGCNNQSRLYCFEN